MNTTNKNQNPVSAFAKAEAAKANGWALLALAVNGHTVPDAENILLDFETAFRKGNKSEALPAAYRSAKSVALKALRLGVALVGDVTDDARGKTAVEKDCKAAQAAADDALLAELEADEVTAGEMVVATAEEYRARFAALILAAKESGFDPAAIFADAYARTLPTDAL
jgi:hypothetical protein